MPNSKGLPKKYAKMGFKKGWKAYKAQQRKTSTKRRSSTRKGQVRKTARRAFRPKRNNPNNRSRKMRKSIPHPSLTGLASGALVFSWLNSKSGWTGRTEGKESVTSWLAKGNLNKASMRFIENAKTMFKADQGLKTVGSAVVIATAGAIARKQFGNPKIGGSKIYARL